jgi:hypothetical protein
MNLNNEVIDYIQNVVKCAQLVNIDSVIIEHKLVRAVADDKTVFMFQEQNVPSFFDSYSIGLNRLSVFASRLDVAKTSDNFSIEAVLDDDNQAFARALVMKGKGLKIDYRCANPKTILAPKRFNDTLKVQIDIPPESVVLLQRAVSAMQADIVTLISNDKGVSFELTDVNSDVFSHTITTEAKALTPESDTYFVHRYPVKLLLTLLKTSPRGGVSIGQKGVLNIVLNQLNIFVMPQV